MQFYILAHKFKIVTIRTTKKNIMKTYANLAHRVPYAVNKYSNLSKILQKI